jgi:hypothetical protein
VSTNAMAHFSLEIAHDIACPGADVAADSEEVAPCESSLVVSRSQTWLPAPAQRR